MKLSLEDRLLIYELIASYGHVTDDRDPDVGPDRLFASDVVYDLVAVGGPVTHGLEVIQARWSDPDRPHRVMHHQTNVVVTPVSEAAADVLFKGVAVGGGGRVASLVYRGRVVRTDDGWRFSALSCAPMRLPPRRAG
jgi:hypothetical protein